MTLSRLSSPDGQEKSRTHEPKDNTETEQQGGLTAGFSAGAAAAVAAARKSAELRAARPLLRPFRLRQGQCVSRLLVVQSQVKNVPDVISHGIKSTFRWCV